MNFVSIFGCLHKSIIYSIIIYGVSVKREEFKGSLNKYTFEQKRRCRNHSKSRQISGTLLREILVLFCKLNMFKVTFAVSKSGVRIKFGKLPYILCTFKV